MGQSATLYRVSNHTFRQLEKSDTKPKFDISNAKSFTTFDGSFMGLEYILSKGQGISTTELIKQIFSPKQSVGGQNFESLTQEEQFELYESGSYIPYLDSITISEIDKLLDNVSIDDIHAKYDAKELNDNDIYPCVWYNDNSPSLSVNERQLAEDFAELKTVFKQASLDGDYLLVFVG